MDDEEKLNGEPRSPDEVFTKEEYAKYRALLDEAYPSPEDSCAPGVLAAIRQERKRRIVRLATRWGSLAACLAIVTFLGIRLMNDQAVKKTQDGFYATDDTNAGTVEEIRDDEVPLAPVTDSTSKTQNEDAGSAEPEAPEKADEYVENSERDSEISLFPGSTDQTLPDDAGETDQPSAPTEGDRIELPENDALEEVVAETEPRMANEQYAGNESETDFTRLFYLELAELAGTDAGEEWYAADIPSLMALNPATLTEEAVRDAWNRVAEAVHAEYPELEIPSLTDLTGLTDE